MVSVVHHLVIVVQVPHTVVQLLWYIQALSILALIVVSQVVQEVIVVHLMASMYQIFLK